MVLPGGAVTVKVDKSGKSEVNVKVDKSGKGEVNVKVSKCTPRQP